VLRGGLFGRDLRAAERFVQDGRQYVPREWRLLLVFVLERAM